MRIGLSDLISLPLAAIPAVFLVIASCATTADTAPPVHGATGAICTADGLDRFIGEPATQSLGAEILRASGASKLRWVSDGAMITMDHREDRVTVHLTSENKIEKLRCG